MGLGWRAGLPCSAALLALVLPGSARAHAAFGDLGPLFGTALHPLADPAQGLLLVATGILLARQPRPVTRIGFGVLAGVATVTLLLALVTGLAVPSARIVVTTALALAALALTGRAVPAAVMAALSALSGGLLALSIGPPQGSALLAFVGGAGGIALLTLLVWGIVDLAQDRLGRVAGAVVAAWVVAIGLMVLALPG
jgi:hypothetical protein